MQMTALTWVLSSYLNSLHICDTVLLDLFVGLLTMGARLVPGALTGSWEPCWIVLPSLNTAAC